MVKLSLPLLFEIELHADTVRHRQSGLGLTLSYRLQAWTEPRQIQRAEAQAGIVRAVPGHISEGR